MSNDRYTQARRITLWSAGFNALLGLLKVVFGFLGNSHALFADGIHSFSDLITDGLVICAAHYGSREADLEHPYGHGRIETLATSGLALLLISAGLGIVWDASSHIQHPLHVFPAKYVFIIALFSVVVNEALFFYMKAIADRIHSKLVRANAWHHRSDAFSSLIVLLGIVGTFFGYVFFDALAAVLVGLLIVKMGAELAWSSMRELIDTGVDEAMLQQLKSQIAAVPGVDSVHQLRTRSSNGQILVDVHVIVAPTLSVSEGHHIGQTVHQTLCDSTETVNDVIVHIDPEDDEVVMPSIGLPARQQLVQILQDCWQDTGILEATRQINLHYLNGELHVELILPLAQLTRFERDEVKQALFAAIKEFAYIKKVVLYYTE